MLKTGSLLVFLGVLGAMSPTLSGLYPVILIFLILIGLQLTRDLGRKEFIAFFILALPIFFSALSGLLSIELTTVVLASGLIAFFFPQFIAIALLLLFIESPLFQSFTLIVVSWLPIEFQQSAPVLICLSISLFIYNRSIFKVCIFASLIILGSFISWHLNLNVLATGYINSLILGVFFVNVGGSQVSLPKYKFYVVVALLSIHSIFIWNSSNRFEMGRVFVWIPSSMEKYESHFFKDYSSTLSLAGIKASQIANVAQLEENSLVIVPWGTDIEAEKFLQDLKISPYSKSITVLVGGEHTNYGGFADRLNPLFSGGVGFNNTTTVPPQNANHMGALWTSSVLQFPFDAILNRGASLRISSLNAFPILIAKSIFSDLGPKEFNDFWVGDFLLGNSDPRGWTLLMTAYKDGPLWILSGDNSYLLNRYLLPNPRPIAHVISLASLFPMLILELWILVVICTWGFRINRTISGSIRSKYIYVIPIFLLVPIAITLKTQLAPNYEMSKALFQNLKYFGGDERSSAVAISENSKAINESPKKLFVHETSFTSKDIGNSGLEEIHIGNIKNDFSFNGVKLDNCGLTSYSNLLDPKINLQEAQYCKVTGDAKIIVGDKNQASVIEIQSTPPVTLILDKYFLSGSPPIYANIKYLLSLLDSANSR
ncbi:hypothetical protein [Mesorhizobium japonicum]|uniref:hypothetical protein n=1 Tax=Mesorhizobium japonicum TaxID=2066070 RepID=UPI003B58E3A7